MKNLKYIALLFVGIAFMSSTSCKKYPDGPILSLETKAFRLTGWNFKRWNVDYFSIDGYDSTEYLKSQPLFGTYIFSSKRKDEWHAEFVYNSNGNTGSNSNNYYSAGGYWWFINHKKSLVVASSSTHPGKHFNIGAYAADYVTWDIQRLTEKDLWLKCTYNSKEYFVKFIN